MDIGDLGKLFLGAAGLYFVVTCSLNMAAKTPINCTNSQLHEVIEKVEQCTKQNVICSTKMKDKILSEVCR